MRQNEGKRTGRFINVLSWVCGAFFQTENQTWSREDNRRAKEHVSLWGEALKSSRSISHGESEDRRKANAKRARRKANRLARKMRRINRKKAK